MSQAEPAIHTPDWVKDAVFYQIFPDRFAKSDRVPKPTFLQPWGERPQIHKYQGGDLLGVAEHLEYLADLGVSAIYFCPVFQSASNHRYHTHDYLHVDPMLGGDAALRELLEAAHARGVKVVLDGVFNHASRGFFQFSDILENGQDSAYLDWFHVEGFPLRPYDMTQPANYQSWWNNRALPKFNTGTPAVREFLLGVATRWTEFGIDGWRLDVPNEIDDDAFWREFRRRVKAVNSDAYIVGEIWDDPSRWLAGDQFDAVMNYQFTRLCLGFFAARTLNQVVNGASGIGFVPTLDASTFAQRVTELARAHPSEIAQAQLNLLGSHDTARFPTAAGGDEGASQLATIFQMTYLGAPCIYYGDEIGLTGGPDPDCRGAFPWGDRDSWNAGTLDLTRRLAHARRHSQLLTRGDFEVLRVEGEMLAYRRTLGDQSAYILLNAGLEARSLDLADLRPGRYAEVLGGEMFELAGEQNFELAPRSALVLLPA